MSPQLMSCESLPQKEAPVWDKLPGYLSLYNFEAENNARQKEVQ